MEEHLESFVTLLNRHRQPRPVSEDLAHLPDWARRALSKPAEAPPPSNALPLNGTAAPSSAPLNGATAAHTAKPLNGTAKTDPPQSEIAVPTSMVASPVAKSAGAGNAESRESKSLLSNLLTKGGKPSLPKAPPIGPAPAVVLDEPSRLIERTIAELARSEDSKAGSKPKPVAAAPVKAGLAAAPSGKAGPAAAPRPVEAKAATSGEAKVAPTSKLDTAKAVTVDAARAADQPIASAPPQPTPASEIAKAAGSSDAPVVDRQIERPEPQSAATIEAAANSLDRILADLEDAPPPLPPTIGEAPVLTEGLQAPEAPAPLLSPPAVTETGVAAPSKRPVAYAVAAVAVVAVVALVGAGGYWYAWNQSHGIGPVVAKITPAGAPKIVPKIATIESVIPRPAAKSVARLTLTAGAGVVAAAPPASGAAKVATATVERGRIAGPKPGTGREVKPAPVTVIATVAEKPKPAKASVAANTVPPVGAGAKLAAVASAKPAPAPVKPSASIALAAATVMAKPPTNRPTKVAMMLPPPSSAAIDPMPPPKVPDAEGGEPTWLRNAVPAPPFTGQPQIAIVIDDLGLDRNRTARAIALRGPVTLSFLAYASDLRSQTEVARRAGHELIVHVPMEPIVRPKYMAGSGGAVAHDEVLRRLRWDLARFDGYVGVNNHIGNQPGGDLGTLDTVIGELKARGLLFLDARAESGPTSVAERLGVPTVWRDVLLDDDITAAAVNQRLADLEKLARQRGTAVAVGHPHDQTLEALTVWLAALPTKGLQLVPLTAIVKDREQHIAGVN